MGAMERHKLKRLLIHGDAAAGAAGAGADATLYSNLFAEVAKGVGGAVAAKQQTDAASKAAADAAKKNAAASANLDAAKLDLQQKQKAAMQAQADAHAAQIKAGTETDPNGPMHKAAADAQKKATLYAADVAAAQDKVNFYSAGGTGTAPTSALTKHMKGASGALPSWVMPVGIGVGVLGVGFFGYKLFSKKHRR